MSIRYSLAALASAATLAAAATAFAAAPQAQADPDPCGRMALAALYLVSPIDLVPDAIPFFGLVDDAVIVPAAVYGLMHLLPHGVRAESEYQADYVLRHARAVLILASAFIVCWMALLLWGICRLLAG